MKETPNAQQSFEDYYGLGPERSLRKLADEYEQRQQTADKPPTVRFETLATWSTEHNWQQRIIDRVREDGEEVRESLRERAVAFRERVAGAIEVDVTRLLQRLQDTKGELLAESAADLERLVKLYYQLAEQPLSDRHEVAGNMGVVAIPLPVFGPDDPLNTAEGRDLIGEFAEKYAEVLADQDEAPADQDEADVDL